MSEEQLPYHQQRLLRKNGQLPPLPTRKPKKPLKKQSDKKIAEIKAEKELRGEDDTQKEKWFKARRKEMKGFCACGCAEKSSKSDDVNFRSSICHIFPQRLFPSIQFHRLNWVERKFWATNGTSACHAQMDNKSMDLWPNMEDWGLIKDRFLQLSLLLTQKEKVNKFYLHLAKLVNEN